MLLESPIFKENTKELKELATKYFGYLSFDELPWKTAEKGVNQHIANLYEMGRKSIELEKPFNTENCAKREYKAIITTLNQ